MTTKDKILSIQSKLVYGYVGSNIAELAIQLHQLDVIAYPTVYLSAHTGHKPIYGTQINVDLFNDLIKGIKNLHLEQSLAGIITGYIGSTAIVHSSSKYIQSLKTKNNSLKYICDPVMGDVSCGLYVSEELAQQIIEKLIPICDYTTPNHFEFEYITKRKINTLEEITEAIEDTPILHDKKVIITSCKLIDSPSDKIETILIDNKNITRISSDKAPMETTGTGDFFCSLLISKLVAENLEDKEAIKKASDTVSKALHYLIDNQLEELNAKSVLISILH